MVRVGIVAPGRRLGAETQAKLVDLVTASQLPVELSFHPQCQLSHGHFAGTDQQRLSAFLDYANEPSIDAIWFARGGYGAARLLSGLAEGLEAPARKKVYLGYSDMGFLLAALWNAGCHYCAHGPLVGDLDRIGGEQAALRSLRFLARDGIQDLAAGIVGSDHFNLAFNLSILRSLCATPWMPVVAEKACLWSEDVGEYVYATDRSMFQVINSEWFQSYVSAVRIGRFSLVPENDITFGMTSEESVAFWCNQAGVEAHGRADIGHDSDNKIVPFGYLSNWQKAGLI
jgi:muramoyltetrapeptide carboxypeptidase